jgi:molybdate transport system regulatory protein
MRIKLKLQVYCDDEIAIGPGKAELLDAIGNTGSISAAARSLGMSYRRAWLLVDVMNRCFAEPLVATKPGGGKSAGAQMTPHGRAVLTAYRGLSQQVEAGAVGADLAAIAAVLRDQPLPPG